MTFAENVYAQVMCIPRGKVATYGQIAALCGVPNGARAVGTALHRNPVFGVVPCHRVVNRDGRLAPAFAFGGPEKQRSLLAEEGVTFNESGRVRLLLHSWNGQRCQNDNIDK